MELCTPQDIANLVLPDLRQALRERGLNPAGGKQTLVERLLEGITSRAVAPMMKRAQATVDTTEDISKNNYSRPDGQNVGNHVSDRPSSKVLAPPGGVSSISLGGYDIAASAASNNYARPGGQNVGNFITDRPSSRIVQPPGGASQIVFGNYSPPRATPAPAQSMAGPGAAYAAYAPAPVATPAYVPPPSAYASPSAQHQHSQAMFGLPVVAPGAPGGGPEAGELMSEQDMKKMCLPDLRVACRERGLSPAGGVGQLVERLVECIQGGGCQPLRKRAQALPTTNENSANNYARPDGQNVGNFMGDRPSSRVVQPPGGASSFQIGGGSPPPHGAAINNYARPNGAQNMGNYITDRPSSKVMQPPGGRSQIIF